MELWVKITVWCLVVAVLSSHSEQASRHRRQGSREPCSTPKNNAGICINIKECPLHLDYLVNKRNQPGVVEYLQAAVCRRQGTEIFTCCPIERSVSTQSNGRCQTPRKTAGNCISIRQCPELLDMLTTRSKEPGVVEYLRASQCGFQGGDPRVCCPIAGPGPSPGPVTRPPVAVTNQPSNGLPGTDICGVSESSNERVVNGRPALLGAWPWMVALGYRSPTKPLDWLCGGSLISNRYVLTAAHCVSNLGRRSLIIARLGDLNLNDSLKDGASPLDMPVERSIPHEKYNAALHTVDIALVKLKNIVQFSKFIKPICIPSPSTFSGSLEGYSPFIMGWGATSYRGPATTALQEAQIEITDLESCSNAYRGIKGATIDDRVICAESPMGSDACQGDSGGPLVLPKRISTSTTDKANFFLIGVVSYGYKCAEPGYPGIYSKVSLYEDWIKRNIS